MHSVLRTNNVMTEEPSMIADVALGRATTLSSSVDIVKSGDLHEQPDASGPPPNPCAWKYRPLFLRQSPNSSMIIRGIRYSSSTEHLEEFGSARGTTVSMPINFGNEEEGQCLVIDFTTNLFEGTALFRIKLDRRGHDECEQNRSYYFAGRKRTFQAVIKGRFLKSIPISQCVTGQIFERPPAKLPPKLILRGAESLFKKLAPQLTIDLDGKRPKFLSPLASTAQTVIYDDWNSQGIERDMREPDQADPESLHQHLTKPCSGKSSPKKETDIKARIKARKKAFDRNFARKDMKAKFDPGKEYTFEFFQHLIHFNDFSVDLGVAGRYKLGGVLNGQPLKCMAARYYTDDVDQLEFLWAFDIWHECLCVNKYI